MISRSKLINILLGMCIYFFPTYCQNGTMESDGNGVPYIALISSRLGQSTGVIIHAEWILTSAYSLVDKDGIQLHDSELLIGVAFTRVYQDDWTRLMKYHSKKVIVHENYHKNSTIPDIGLIQTDALLLNKPIHPISIRARLWSTMENNDCFEIEWKKDVDPPNKYKHYLAKWKVVALHGVNACPCIKNFNYLENYICLKGTCGCTYCSSNVGGAVICEMELVGIKHQLIDCRLCEIGRPTNSCQQQSLYRMYTYVCPYRTWISKYVTVPKDLKYDVVCSHYESKRNRAQAYNCKLMILQLITIILSMIKYCIELYFIKVF